MFSQSHKQALFLLASIVVSAVLPLLLNRNGNAHIVAFAAIVVACVVTIRDKNGVWGGWAFILFINAWLLRLNLSTLNSTWNSTSLTERILVYSFVACQIVVFVFATVALFQTGKRQKDFLAHRSKFLDSVTLFLAIGNSLLFILSVFYKGFVFFLAIGVIPCMGFILAMFYWRAWLHKIPQKSFRMYWLASGIFNALGCILWGGSAMPMLPDVLAGNWNALELDKYGFFLAIFLWTLFNCIVSCIAIVTKQVPHNSISCDTLGSPLPS